MKINEVPQDQGMIGNPNLREICYTVDESGGYVLAPSAGWEPKNIANGQVWELIRREVSAVLSKIRSGKLSSLTYHMAKHQMSVGLLAKYVGINRLRVWRHLKPSGFKRLAPDLRKRYADLFDLPVEALGAANAALHVGQLIRMQEEIDTGGCGFRFMYAAFLQEAAPILRNARLLELPRKMTATGDLWRKLAVVGARICKGRASEDETYGSMADLLREYAARESLIYQEQLEVV